MSDYILRKIKISGFNSDKTLNFDPSDHANILIGRNGTGKTRLINLIQGSLKADAYVLANAEFNKIELELKSSSKKSTRKISISREFSEMGDLTLIYKIGTRSYRLRIPFRSLDLDFGNSLARRRLQMSFEVVKRELSNLVNVSSISVYREVDSREYSDDNHKNSRLNAVDIRITVLLEQLKTYQLELANQAAEESVRFQRNVLSLMLWDSNLDKYSIDTVDDELGQQRIGLVKAYKELDAYNKTVERKIDAHIDQISNAIRKLRSGNFAENGVTLEDIFPIPLLRRTNLMIEISSQTDLKRRQIFEPTNEFISILQSYLVDKQIFISKNGDIVINNSEKSVNVLDLSSGEKQIIIILIEALLQRRKPNIFLADEPELSLHIAWQEKILGDIFRLNPKAQLIVATHSPEINAYEPRKTFNMERLINNG